MTIDLTKLPADSVLVALHRPSEGYEDVCPELVSEDAIKDDWPEYTTVGNVSDVLATLQAEREAVAQLVAKWRKGTPKYQPDDAFDEGFWNAMKDCADELAALAGQDGGK